MFCSIGYRVYVTNEMNRIQGKAHNKGTLKLIKFQVFVTITKNKYLKMDTKGYYISMNLLINYTKKIIDKLF